MDEFEKQVQTLESVNFLSKYRQADKKKQKKNIDLGHPVSELYRLILYQLQEI